MIKILITVLAVLIVASGAVGAVAAGADENTMESLQLWTRQLFQEQIELQTQEQTQARFETGQPVTDQDTPLQTRLRLENQEQLQLQEQIQNQLRIQLQQNADTQNAGSYPWNTEVPCSGNSYGPGSSPNPLHDPQTGGGLESQQRGRP